MNYSTRSIASRSASTLSAARPQYSLRAQWLIGRRWIQISTQPAGGASPEFDQLSIRADKDISGIGADAAFEVLGAPYSLLKVTLSASQPLHTRRGSLVGLSGKPDNVISTLSFLEPVTRAVLGIPFFYQKITSASPVTALLSSKSNFTSFATVHLDGTLDWMVARRNALLCWTGENISLSPRMNTRLSLAHWGSTQVTGRGLLGVVGKGQIYEIDVAPGEQYTVHPGNVVAYSMNQSTPLPYRFKSTTFRLQVPGLNAFQTWAKDIKFFRNMQETSSWKFVTKVLYTLRTWSRRTFMGDRLFLQFHGPTTILLQTRGSRMTDVVSGRDISELAESEPGAISAAMRMTQPNEEAVMNSVTTRTATLTKVSYATIESDGKVKFDSSRP